MTAYQDEDIKKLEKEREKLNDQWNGHRDNIYKEKLQEIEDAHNKWLSEKAEHDQKAAEEAAARGDDVITKMKLTPDNEDYAN